MRETKNHQPLMQKTGQKPNWSELQQKSMRKTALNRHREVTFKHTLCPQLHCCCWTTIPVLQAPFSK